MQQICEASYYRWPISLEMLNTDAYASVDYREASGSLPLNYAD